MVMRLLVRCLMVLWKRGVEMLKPKELDAQRKVMIDRGLFLGDLVDADMVKRLVPRNRFFVIQDKGVNVGFMQVGYYEDKQQGKVGFTLGVKSRIKTAAPVGKDGNVIGEHVGQMQTSTALSFMAEDGSYDLFESGNVTMQYTEMEEESKKGRRAVRPRYKRDLQKFSVGMQCYRDEDLISIQKDFGLDRRQPLVSRVKPGYLNQLQAFDLGYYLPHRKEQFYGYYAFDGVDKVIKLHLAHVVPAKDGSYVVKIFAGFDRLATLYQFDKEGELSWWQLPSGYKIVVTDLKTAKAVKDRLFPK